MKKFLLILAIGAFVACNDSATSTDNGVDSTADANVDSLGATSDSTMMNMDTTTTPSVDTLK